MSTVADATTRAAAARDELAWHGLTAEEACTRRGVDPIVFIVVAEVGKEPRPRDR